MSPSIEVEDLAKSFADLRAVAQVSFRVSEGEIFGYLGRNGSGKTTTVRMLTTLTRPSSGRAKVAGFDVVADPMAVKSHIGVTMQDAALDPQMSGIEHLRFIARILGYTPKAASARSGEMLELFGLTEAASRAIGTYSGGMKRRLDIATALLGQPRVLFLDEPTTGLDPQSRRALWEEIRRLKQSGVTVFLTTQYLEEAEQLADHLAIIDRGRIISQGTVAQLRQDHGRKKVSFRPGAGIGQLADELRSTSGWEVGIEGERIVIEVAAEVSDREVLAIIDRLATSGYDLAGLQVADTSLEDVFLRLTGTGINETLDPVAVSA